MRILLTGASGLVGAAFARAANAQGHHVIGTTGRFPGIVEALARQVRLDLADETAVCGAFAEARPDAIVNCAAISEPAECEADPERSHRINVRLPSLLARIADRARARIVHVSSEQVFSGEHAPYHAGAPVSPVNRYGRQKAESEQGVRAAAPALFAVVRAPLLTGNSLTGRRSLHERLLADWAAGRTPRLFADEIRQVAHADNLAAVLLELCGRHDLTGVFHWAGLEPLSRWELGVRIRDRFGLTQRQAPLARTTRSENPEVIAIRAADLRLELSPLTSELITQPQTLAQQLDHLKVPAFCQSWVEHARRQTQADE